ncbi:MAG: hypothetical protein U1C53_00195, partial [Candidatus Veblenbacteria bacterium]|nr:hypothetical protein [Candidatus Veblenbacteria bacterium]
SAGTFDPVARRWTFIRLNNYATAELSLVLVARGKGEGVVSLLAQARERDIDASNNQASVRVAASEPVVSEVALPQPPAKVLGETIASCELPTGTGEAEPGWTGYALLPAEGGALWYWEPVSGRRYCIGEAARAYQALGAFGLGITNADLARIPVAEGEPVTVEAAASDTTLAERLKGRIVLQVESLGEAWYVDPRNGHRHYLANGASALSVWGSLSLSVPGTALAAIPLGILP